MLRISIPRGRLRSRVPPRFPSPVSMIWPVTKMWPLRFSISWMPASGSYTVTLPRLFAQATGGNVSTDFIRFFDTDPEHRIDFSDVGWDARVNQQARSSVSLIWAAFWIGCKADP